MRAVVIARVLPAHRNAGSRSRAARLASIRAAREEVRSASADLYAEIRTALGEGHKPSEIARAAEFSREYVAKIRDGRTKS